MNMNIFLGTDTNKQSRFFKKNKQTSKHNAEKAGTDWRSIYTLKKNTINCVLLLHKVNLK